MCIFCLALHIFFFRSVLFVFYASPILCLAFVRCSLYSLVFVHFYYGSRSHSNVFNLFWQTRILCFFEAIAINFQCSFCLFCRSHCHTLNVSIFFFFKIDRIQSRKRQTGKKNVNFGRAKNASYRNRNEFDIRSSALNSFLTYIFQYWILISQFSMKNNVQLKFRVSFFYMCMCTAITFN